jgi:hypothetical protein
MGLRRSRRAVLAAAAGGALIAASLAACGPTAGGSADATSSATAASSTTPDDSLDSMPFGSVGGGFVPLPDGSVASVPVGAGQTVTVPVAGHGGVPASGAGAVALAVATAGGAVGGAVGGGSVTVYPAGASPPDAPSLSWPGGQAASGTAVSGLGGAGSVAVRNSSGHQVTVSLDADGYWLAGTPAAAGAFGSLTGARLARVVVAGGQTVTVPVAGHAGVPASGAGTVALTAAVTSGFGTGSVTVYPADARRPDGPSLSWTGGTAASGLVVSALSRRGTVAVHNSSFLPVTVTLDAAGYWLSGAPAASGTFGVAGRARVARVRVGAGQTVPVPVAGQGGVPASGAGAAALAVQVATGRSAGSVTLYPAGASFPDTASLPDVASLSWAARGAASGLAISALSDDGAVAVHNSSAQPVTVTLAAAGYWLSKGRVVSDVTPKPTTVTLTGSDVAGVSGDPAATETVALAAGVPAPAVGRVLAAPVSATAPDGLLGTVTAVTAGTGGTHVVTLSPATLDQAYSTFDVSTSQVLTDSDVVPAQAGPGAASPGQTLTAAATPLYGPRAPVPTAGPELQARDLSASTPALSFSLSALKFSCQSKDTGTGAGPSIALTADLTKTSVDLSLDANPSAPNIHFLITAYPVFNLNVGFTGTVVCQLSEPDLLKVRIPIPGTPGLVVTLSPVISLSATGQASVDFQWTPRMAVGFDKGPGVSTDVHAFGSSGNVAASATASADLFVGTHADISLAGRVGVGGDFGPDLPVTYDAAKVCVTVDGQLKADLTASADVFVKNWTFALAEGDFGNRQLYQKCGGQTAPSSPASVSPSSPPTGATSSSGPPTSAPGESWMDTAVQAPLPPGGLQAPLMFSVSCWAASQCAAVGTYSDESGATYGLLLTGAGNSWTAVQAPLPANGTAIVFVSKVSCWAASQCVATGDYTDKSGVTDGLLLTDSGGSWTAAEAPLPADASATDPGAGLSGVSCLAASQCVVTGGYYGASGGSQGMLLTDPDGSWRAVSAPDSGEISCSAASQCVIAGYSQNLYTYSAGTWTQVPMPLPANAAPVPYYNTIDVSCWAASQCVAIGAYTDTSGNLEGVLLTDSGGSWTAAEAPLPSGALPDNPVMQLSSVSCWAASQCVAVGGYGNRSGVGNGVLLTDSGGSWTAAGTPQPSNTSSSDAGEYLNGVSCLASQCVGVTAGGLMLTVTRD